MSDPTYNRAEINAKPEWGLAFVLSEIMNDQAPVGWSRYVWVAQSLLATFTITRKSPAHDNLRSLFEDVKTEYEELRQARDEYSRQMAIEALGIRLQEIEIALERP